MFTSLLRVSLLLLTLHNSASAWALPRPNPVASPSQQLASQPRSAMLKDEHEIIQARVPVGHSATTRGGDPSEKYFHESSFDPHYDGRFTTERVPYHERRAVLMSLARAYFSVMQELGAETWIMHGSLLGWWWNKRIMPWDSDLDVMVSESSMEHLARHSNMTVYHFKDSASSAGRDYMLEINPHFRNTSGEDSLNKIDGRFLDMHTGLFIDITTLHHNATAEALGLPEQVMSKDGHRYREEYIFPLRESQFEGVKCMVPYGYAELLLEEYGSSSLVERNFEGHFFDSVRMDWIPLSELEETMRSSLTIPSPDPKQLAPPKNPPASPPPSIPPPHVPLSRLPPVQASA